MKFYLPDFGFFMNLNMTILDLMKEYPDYFNNNIEIGGIYGTFPGAIWNGGRLLTNHISSAEEMEHIVSVLNKRNIPIRYTFTNHLLEEKHLNDTYCNLMMEIANTGMNEIIINSPILEDYLRKEYPNFKYILSTTRCERDINKINEATKKYDLVVTDYRDNPNIEFLQAIEDKSKIELLINAYCDPNCPIRKKHYTSIANHQLRFEDMDKEKDADILKCPTYKKHFYDILEYPTVLTNKDVLKKYPKMGFNHFKIEGRTMPIAQVIESYVYYLVKPEYQNEIRLLILERCIGG